MGKFILLVIGVSPVLAFVIFLVLQENQKSDAQILERHIETNMEINTFNRDFELQLSEMSDTEEGSRLHKVFASEHAKKNIAIEDERKEAKEKRKRMEKKSSSTFTDLESEMKRFDSNNEDEVKLDEMDFDNF